MSAIEVFNYGESVLRTVEQGDDILFVARDILDALDLTHTTNSLDGLDDDELSVVKVQSGGQMREMKAVTEAGLYKLIFKSRKDGAKEFQRFVTHEVLPSIRKTGSYGIQTDTMGLIAQSIENQTKFLSSQTQMMGMMVELMAKMVEKNEAQANPLNGITISFSQNPKENEDERNEFVDAVARYLLENREGRTQGQILNDVNNGVGNSTKIRWLKQYIGRVWRVEIIMGNRYVYTII